MIRMVTLFIAHLLLMNNLKDGKGNIEECPEKVDEEKKAQRYWINLDLCRVDREAQFFVREVMRKNIL